MRVCQLKFLTFYSNFLCCLSYIFNAFDKNHDDHLDFKEFILAGVAADKNDVTSRLEFVFDM